MSYLTPEPPHLLPLPSLQIPYTAHNHELPWFKSLMMILLSLYQVILLFPCPAWDIDNNSDHVYASPLISTSNTPAYNLPGESSPRVTYCIKHLILP
jgi:hypothetical protein